MESCSLRSATATATVVATSSRIGSTERKFLHGQVVKLPSSKRCAPIRRANKNNIEFRAGASGTTRMSTGATEAVPSKLALKDDGLAFVAGATGRVGSRTVRELLKLGYRVRAAVRSAEKAEALVQSVKQIKLEYGNTTEGLKSVEMLEIVECDLERPGQIGPALGNASVVICCIGASEKEVFDVTGPYRIDFQATKNLIDAATVAKVNQFILVSSLGTNKIGFPAAILNLFWGVLIWKRKAEEALIASGVPYTIVRPGGMERPTDAYKETHNITLSEEDTLFGGQVSNLQVAELMAVMAKNRDLAYCKVVEVIAETTAPLTPVEDLLARIPSQRPKLKELDASGGPPSAPSTVEKSVPSSTPVIEETSTSKAVTMRPLSPYPFYDDLKPPTSPTPTSPSSSKENSDTVTQINALGGQISIAVPSSGIDETTENGVAQKEKPLSPFAAYDESKPPSSPSLIPSAPQSVSSSISEVDEVVIPVAGVNDVVTESDKVIEKDLPEGPASYRSPYYVYEDLKPPTSPSPSSPSTQPLSFSSVNVSGNDAPKPSTENKLLDGEEKKKLRPLSPYSAYEDLKPPTSPTPFPKNF